MSVKHYFNSAGEWIAFRRSHDDRYLFDRHGNWIGWFPWNDNDIVDVDGGYLGTVVDGNRIYRRTKTKLNRPHPGFSVPPGPTGYAGHPGYAAYSAPPLGFADAVLKRPNSTHRHRTTKRLPPPPKPTMFQIWIGRLGLTKVLERFNKASQPKKRRRA